MKQLTHICSNDAPAACCFAFKERADERSSNVC